MTLAAGTKLGPYEILSPLGAGGMGEVYRAKDPRLGREVAVKVVRDDLLEGWERKQRFEREAKLLAALNHPNVAAILSFEEIPGSPGTAPRHILVMELLEGETLRSAFGGARVSTKKALEWARQVAQGLAAAHEKGIVHRDLKPENVFVTKDGRIKILDFGLAKLAETGEAANGTNLPTASKGTEPGVVLGTLGYMSPEQVKGKPADSRSDIFAFGAILYEMLSGRRAFSRETAAETISAILKEDPPDLSVTNQSVPPGLERIVSHCLEKNPEQRFHSAHDLAFDLESISGTSGASVERPATSAARRRARLAPGAALLAVVLALVAGLAAGRVIWRASAAPPTFHRVTYGRGTVIAGRFAPDGQTVVYSAMLDGAKDPDLYSVRMEHPVSLRLSVSGHKIESISRSGEMLILNTLHNGGGYARVGNLSQVPVSGSGARELLEDVGAAAWAPDGASFAVVHAPGWRYRLEFPSGKVLYETTGWISFPRVSPQGDAVAFFDHPILGDDRGDLSIVDRQGRKKTLSTKWESEQGLAWSPAGDEVWFTAAASGSSRNLYAVSRSGRQRSVLRVPGTLTLEDIARDGRVLLAEVSQRLGFLGYLPGETKPRDLTAFEWSDAPILSADGRTAIFTEQGETAGLGYAVYQRGVDGSAPVRLGDGSALAISSDGKWVLACRLDTTPPSLTLLPTGAGEAKPFPKDAIDASAGLYGGFLPDGKSVFYGGHEPGRPARVFVRDLQGGPARPVTPEGSIGLVGTPDGKAIVTREPDRSIGLMPLDGGPVRPIPGAEATDQPIRWSGDGRFLFVRSNRREIPARIWRLDVQSGRRELWRTIEPGDPAGITTFVPSAMSEDGKTVLVVFFQNFSTLYVAEGLR